MSHPAPSKTSERQRQQQMDSPSVEPSRKPGSASPYAGILGLQRAAGNLAVSQLLQSVTDSLPPVTNGVPLVVQSVLNNGGGQPLEPAIRGVMESRFGHDFSHVRVHTDVQAAESARAVNAASYT